MLRYFLESRKPYRVWNRPAQQLADTAECSLIMAQEVQWGLYDPLPQRFESVIDKKLYDDYRFYTRQEFGEAFGSQFDVFTTFVDLADFFNSSYQEVAKALCIQRSLMQAHDRAFSTGKKFYRAEILSAFVQSVGPEYAFDKRNGLMGT